MPTVYTVGHSNYPLEEFLALLRAHRIEVVVDTRSQPYSKYATHFNHDVLRSAVETAGAKYLYLGKELGGRPEGTEYYDVHGHVLYDRVAASPLFREGLARLLEDAGRWRLALMCAEENPAGCHRRLLVTRVLEEQGAHILHIRGDGRLQSEEALRAEIEAAHPECAQLSLFEEPEAEWKSTRSVSPRKAPNSSSDF